MLVRGFSVACVDGEVGSACRCNALAKMTDREWDLVKNAGWVITPEIAAVTPDLGRRIHETLKGLDKEKPDESVGNTGASTG
jgi:hypothetical protein